MKAARYIEFLEETGVEHAGACCRWAYFREKTAQGRFELFLEASFRIRYLTKVIRWVALLWGINLYFGCYNIFLYFHRHSQINIMGMIGLLVAIAGAFLGFVKSGEGTRRAYFRAERRILWQSQ